MGRPGMSGVWRRVGEKNWRPLGYGTHVAGRWIVVHLAGRDLVCDREGCRASIQAGQLVVDVSQTGTVDGATMTTRFCYCIGCSPVPVELQPVQLGLGLG